MTEIKKNVRWWDRITRYVFGLALLAWAIAGGPWWTLIGMYPLASAAFGFCPGYWVLRLNVRD